MTEIVAPYGNLQLSKFEARYQRVFEAAGCKTQTELADILEIKQSSISDAKKRGSIPAHWLVKLLALRGINPDWIKDGIEPKFLKPSYISEDNNGIHEPFPPVRAIDNKIIRDILHCFPFRDLERELQRRKKNMYSKKSK